MLKSLMLSVLSVVGVGAPVVYIGGVTEVTYVAETNDVNSIDDLVEGNIYSYDLSYYIDNNIQGDFAISSTPFIRYRGVGTATYQIDIASVFSGSNRLRFEWYNPNSNIDIAYFKIYLINDAVNGYLCNTKVTNLTDYKIDFIYARYSGMVDNLIIGNISRCENIPVLSVEHKDNEGLFNILTEFINTNIFTGGVMDSVNFEVLGSTFTLGSYLSLITTIIILGLIIYLLIRLVYWVGCLFTKSFRGR